MTFRESLAIDAELLNKLRKTRRDLIESKALDKASIWSRLWNAHLYWVFQACDYELGSAARFAWHSFLIRYCQTADRIFGGTRYAELRERQRQRLERLQQKAAELEKKRDEDEAEYKKENRRT